LQNKDGDTLSLNSYDHLPLTNLEDIVSISL